MATFSERARVESGQMIGPRIFTTGTIIYGAAGPGYHQDIVDMDEAKSALVRLKAEGGVASISYKNYNLPSRSAFFPSQWSTLKHLRFAFQSVPPEAADSCTKLEHAMLSRGWNEFRLGSNLHN